MNSFTGRDSMRSSVRSGIDAVSIEPVPLLHVVHYVEGERNVPPAGPRRPQALASRRLREPLLPKRDLREANR